MREEIDYSIIYGNVLKHVGIPLMEDIVHHHRLAWIREIVRIPLDRFSWNFFAAWLDELPYGERFFQRE